MTFPTSPTQKNTPATNSAAGAGIWIAAIRPRTLPAAVVPVAVGLAAASRSGALNVPVAAATLVAALLIQVGTNLANDYYDFLSGADGEDRVGPQRVTQAGLISPQTVRAATFAVLGAAALVGLWLVTVGGWPILAIGVLSLLCAFAYTGGPFPLGYHGLGDLFVFLFFGLVAVNGTAFLQTSALDPATTLASVPVGCLATAILVVNNLRDIATDTHAGKRTLAVRLGPAATRAEYVLLVVLAFAALLLLAAGAGMSILAALLALPLAAHEVRMLLVRDGAALNLSLAGTTRLHLAFGALLAAGLAF